MVVDSLAVKDFEWNSLFKYLGTTDICVRYFPWNGLSFLDYGKKYLLLFCKTMFTVVSISLLHLKSFHIFIFAIWFINVTKFIHIFISKFSICEYLKCTYLVIQPVYRKAIFPLFKLIHGIRHRKDSREWSLAKVMR